MLEGCVFCIIRLYDCHIIFVAILIDCHLTLETSLIMCCNGTNGNLALFVAWIHTPQHNFNLDSVLAALQMELWVELKAKLWFFVKCKLPLTILLSLDSDFVGLAYLCAEISWSNVVGLCKQTRSSWCFISWWYKRGLSYYINSLYLTLADSNLKVLWSVLIIS